jgi:hypothetical protein
MRLQLHLQQPHFLRMPYVSRFSIFFQVTVCHFTDGVKVKYLNRAEANPESSYWQCKSSKQIQNVKQLTLILLMWKIVWAPNSIPIYMYMQQNATLHSLFISENWSICFGWYFHPSLGAHTTVSTASGICHTVTAICRYRGRVGNGLSVLWVALEYTYDARTHKR